MFYSSLYAGFTLFSLFLVITYGFVRLWKCMEAPGIHAFLFLFIWYSTQTHHKQYRSFEYTCRVGHTAEAAILNMYNVYVCINAAHVWLFHSHAAIRILCDRCAVPHGHQRAYDEYHVRCMRLIVPMATNACCVFYAVFWPMSLRDARQSGSIARIDWLDERTEAYFFRFVRIARCALQYVFYVIWATIFSGMPWQAKA